MQRTCEDEKLGLTLYYNSPDEEGDGDAMDCYVTHLDPDGVASKDGRIQIGDQVLQVTVTSSWRFSLDNTDHYEEGGN